VDLGSCIVVPVLPFGREVRQQAEHAVLCDQLQAREKDGQRVPAICGYLTKLFENALVKRYIKQSHPEVLTQLEAIVEAISLEQ